MDKDKLKLSQFEDSLIDANSTTPLVVATALLIVLGYFTKTLYTTNPYLIWPTVAVLILFSFTHYIPVLEFTKRHVLYLGSYHVALAFVIIAIVPTLSYYLVLWILLGYLNDYYYQKVGMVVNIVFMSIAVVVGVAYQQAPLNIDKLISTLPWLTVMIGTVLVLSKIILGTKKYRENLSNKMAKAEYEHLRLVALINSMAEAVIAVNDSGKINVYNSAALELFDTNDSIEDHSIGDYLKLYDADNKPIDIMTVASSVAYSTKVSDYYTKIRNENISLEIGINRTKLDNPITHENGYTFLLRDITKQKSFDNEQSDFIAVVSHELRTPVAIAEANISMAEMTTKKQLGDSNQTVSSIKKAHDQVMSLAEMINDLSTLSKAEKETDKFEEEVFDVGLVLNELKTIFTNQAERKKLYIKFETQPDLPKVATSKLYLKEIIQNLISNAIKYTREGGVTIVTDVSNDGQGQISVNDTGIGISKSEQKKVFEKFWRSEDPLTRESEGTGLGLHIASKLAARIGSELKFSSEVGSGSVFYLTVPTAGSKIANQPEVVKSEVESVL